MIGIKLFLHAPGGMEPGHVVHKIRENDLRVPQILQPLGLPFQRNKTVIVDAGQRLHHIRNGHSAFANQLIDTFLVGVPQMHMAHISAQILDGRVCAFFKVPIRMVHIPQRA